jgi:hypothetical protein
VGFGQRQQLRDHILNGQVVEPPVAILRVVAGTCASDSDVAGEAVDGQLVAQCFANYDV